MAKIRQKWQHHHTPTSFPIYPMLALYQNSAPRVVRYFSEVQKVDHPRANTRSTWPFRFQLEHLVGRPRRPHRRPPWLENRALRRRCGNTQRCNGEIAGKLLVQLQNMCEDQSLRVASTFQSGKSKDENFSKWHRQRHTTKLSRTNSIYGRTARKWLYISSGILQFKRVRMSVEVYELKPTHAVQIQHHAVDISVGFCIRSESLEHYLGRLPPDPPQVNLPPPATCAQQCFVFETCWNFVLICSNGLCWGHPANDKH